MKKLAIPLVTLIALGVYFGVLHRPQPGEGAAPDFSIELRDGSLASLSDLQGKYVLLDFWASWCGPCLKDIPKVKKLQADFGGSQTSSSPGFEVFSIALEKDGKRWEKALDRYDMQWKYNALDESKFVRLSKMASLYGVTDIPATFLINPEGKILGVNLPDADIRKILKEGIK